MTKLYLLMRRSLTVFLMFGALVSFAQGQVTGKVTSKDDGSPLPGVNIVEKGTSNGATTDADGNFTIKVGANATLIFSFVGSTTQEVEVGSQTSINVELLSDVTSLSEVVVVGYGTQEKKEISSSVTSVKSEDFNKGTVNDPAQLLQGRVAGLNITRPGGDPNGSFNIRLRGVGTIGANAEPLIVIDGIIGGSLSNVDPNDIASFDVLKDGSAAAIYGSRGGSGVILITTKSGKAGKTQVDYNASYALEDIARTVPVMSAAEYRAVVGGNKDLDLGATTKWIDVVTRQGKQQVHNLSLSGGSKGTSYRASANLRDGTGIGLNSGYQQINARLNLTQKALNDRATFTVNLSTTTRESQLGNDNSFRYAVIANPTVPVYDNTLDSKSPGANFGGYAERNIFDWFNPLSIVEQSTNDKKESKILASIRGEYDFSNVVEGLRASVFYSNQRETDLYGFSYKKTAKFNGNNQGRAGRFNDQRVSQLFETTINYDKTFDKTNLQLLGGYSFQDFFNDGFGAQAGNFLTDAFTYNNLGAALDFANGLGSVYSYANSNKLVAFFGRANVNVGGNYFLSASVRYEGSSRFGANNKFGVFPAVSAGVTLSNLIDIPSVNSLKLRGSYGVTGNQPSSSYNSLQQFGPAGSFFYNGAYGPSYGPATNANPDLKWETKAEIDFGADFALFNNKLTGTFDWYTRTTKDVILPVNVPVPPNLVGQTLINIGELKNNGIELALNYAAVKTADFSWTVGGNVGTYSSKVVSLTSGSLSFGEGGVLYRAGMGSPGQNAFNLVRVKQGDPLGQLWGSVYDGVSDKGEYIFKDINGDGKRDATSDEDRAVIGNGLPKATVGFTNTFTYKQFDLSVFFNGSFGHDLLNSYRGFYENNESTTVNSYNIVKTKYYDPKVTKAQVNSIHVERASYIRLNNASLGYNFKMKAGSPIRNFRIFASGQNLFTITDYTGVDPTERFTDGTGPGADGLSPGIERRNTYFTTRTVTLGLNLGF
jgi:TonB-dependent starch-binding outer membrane protein SusC